MPAARRICKVKAMPTVLAKTRRTQPKPIQHSVLSSYEQKTTQRLRLSRSCPKLTSLSIRQYSSTTSSWPLRQNASLPQITLSNTRDCCKRGYATCDAKCPCPFPCGPCGCKSGCGCLPPPCNTPPKCLQYMTGYYYYPYGTWFCGPYHVAGTCAPVGANGPPCPCPCPAKCCPACVCAAPGQMDKNSCDLNKFPVEVPCQTISKSGIAKFFTFNTPDKKDSEPKQKKPMPPVLASMVCPPLSQQETSNILNKEPRIQSSYPVSCPKQKSRSYHTNTQPISDSSNKTPMQYKHKNWRYSYYQKRHKVATPMERSREFLKEKKNRPRAKLDSVNYSSNPNQKRRDPRPDVDIELKPYDA